MRDFPESARKILGTTKIGLAIPVDLWFHTQPATVLPTLF